MPQKFIDSGLVPKTKGYELPNSRLIDALLSPGKEITRNGKSYKLPKIRVMFNANGSTFTRHPETNRAIKAMQKSASDHHLRAIWTSTANLAI